MEICDERAERAEKILRDQDAILSKHPELTHHLPSLMVTTLRCKASGLDFVDYSHAAAYVHIFGTDETAPCEKCTRDFPRVCEGDKYFFDRIPPLFGETKA